MVRSTRIQLFIHCTIISFTELGFKVYLSEEPQAEGMERELSSFCYPAQLSLGLFQDLVNQNCDYYFLPGIMEMYCEDKAYHQKDTNCTCAFLNTEAYFIPQAFKDCNIKDKIIHSHIQLCLWLSHTGR